MSAIDQPVRRRAQRAHCLPRLEPSPRPRGPVHRTAAGERSRHILSRKPAPGQRMHTGIPVTGQVAQAQHALGHQQVGQRREPFLVIGKPRVILGRQAFAGMARLVEGPAPQRPCRQRHRQRTGVPFRCKHRSIVGIGAHRAIPEPATHVVHPGHDGTLGNPVPIIESRVTSSASAASSQPSVPSGRMGRTR